MFHLRENTRNAELHVQEGSYSETVLLYIWRKKIVKNKSKN